MLDLGTGLRFFGEDMPQDGSFRGAALVTHLHWDHVQGLPFFVPIDRPGARLDVYGPPQDPSGGGVHALHHSSLEAAFEEFMRPPYFPVRFTELRGDIFFHDVTDGDFAVGDAKVAVREVPHIGSTNGYRVEMGGVSVAYISDHQEPRDGTQTVAPEVLELCDGVDLLIHDAQFTAEEFAIKAHWGHCTVDYAVTVARESGAKRLALFHHDPSHHDRWVDRLLAYAQSLAAAAHTGNGLEVIAAAEGLTISLGDSEPVA